MLYLLTCVGIFTLLGNITRGVMVEGQIEITIRGEPVLIDQMVKLNDVPADKMTFGMLGLFISMGISYMAANALSKTWGDDMDKKMSKTEYIIWTGIFTVFFLAFSFIIGVHSILEIWDVPGLLFMALTCFISYVVSKTFCKLPAVHKKITKSNDNGGIKT
jgi:hypothetical protein